MSNTTNLLPIAFKAVVKCKFNKLLICLAMLCASITATAYDFEVDGIYYNKLTNNTCEVTYETTSYKTYSGDIVIPQKVSFDGATYTVTSIGSSAFRYCSNLISIAFPSSLTSIGDLAFDYCSKLKSVTCNWNEPIVASSSSFYTYSGTLYVPKGTSSKYKATSPWCYFGKIIESEAAGVDDVADDNDSTVSVVDGAINVSGDIPVRVVSLLGVTLYNGQGNCNINVAPGFYIVTVGNKTTKVSVK
jgi:hypothetical protein